MVLMQVSLMICVGAIAYLYTRRAEEMLELRTAFVASVSHELRTPLHGLLACAEGLEESEAKQNVMGCGRLLHSHVSNVLDLARLEKAIPLRLKPDRCELVDLLAPLRTIGATSAKQVVVAAPPPGAFLLDAARVTQVLVNLLGNAMRHASTRVTVRVEEADGQLEFWCEDDGPGVDADAQSSLFETWSVGKDGGTGLGLSISRELAVQMGGSLRLEETRGAGASFCLRLPLRHCASSPVEGRKSSLELTPRRVLVVDDNALNARLCERMLERLMCEVQVVHTAEDAIAACKEHEFDVVLMDINLGVSNEDGIEAARAILQHRPTLRVVPATADNTPACRRHCDAVGMQGFLLKPFGLRDLKSALRGAKE